MDVDQLAVLRELRDRGSITAVATATHKSPSAVSQQLRTLQRQVGTALVEPHGRGVRLTDAGEALARASVRIAVAIAEAESEWQSFSTGEAGTVTLAIFPSAAELLLPGLLRRMAAHPAIDLEVLDYDVSEDAFAGLTRDADIVVGHRSDGGRPAGLAGLVVVPLLREPLDVAVSLDHPLAERESVTAAEVVRDRWVSVHPDFPLDRVLMSLSLRAGVEPHIVHRTNHLPLIENLVASGFGIALVPRHTSRSRAAGRFRLLTLADLRAARHVEALARPERMARTAVSRLLDELRAEAAVRADVAGVPAVHADRLAP